MAGNRQQNGGGGGVETTKFTTLMELVVHLVYHQSLDRWTWYLGDGGDFTMRDTCMFIDDYILPHGLISTLWNKLIPIKVNIFH